MAGGVAWMMLFKVAERLLGVVSTLILVRLLLPADFGLVAMATSIIAVVEVMGALSFDTALIHRQDATRSHYDTAWTFNVLAATLIGLTLLVLAAPAAQFYNEPRLTSVVFVLALTSFIGGFENIGVVDFRKSLEFNKEFRFLLVKRLVLFAVVVPLAFILRNYWALVIGTLAGKLGAVAASFVLHPYRPRLSLAARAELLNFSKWLLLNNLVLLARDRSADFAIGRLLGSHQLGLYSVSNEVSGLPLQFTAPVNRAVFPGYAKQAGDLAQLRASFLQVTSLFWLVALPAGVGIALVAPVLVPVVLGANWLEATPILAVLAIFGALMVVQGNIAYVFYALGTPKTQTLLTIAHVVVLLPLLISLTVSLGPIGAAWANLLTAALLVPISFGIVLRRLALPLGVFAHSVWRSATAVLAMSAVVYATLQLMEAAAFEQHWMLLDAVIVGVLSYAAAVFGLWLVSGRPDGVERTVFSIIKQRFPNLSRSQARTAAQRPD